MTEPITDEKLAEIESNLERATDGEWSYYMGYDAGVWCGHDCTPDGCHGHDLPCAVFEGPSRGCRDSEDPSSRALEFALEGDSNYDILLTEPDAKHLANMDPDTIRGMIVRLRTAEERVFNLAAENELLSRRKCKLCVEYDMDEHDPSCCPHKYGCCGKPCPNCENKGTRYG